MHFQPDRLVDELRDAVRTAASADATTEDVLAALETIATARRLLDTAEHLLIEAARERRTTWTQIARALGLASRQAAEQRWLRLGGSGGRDPVMVRSARQRQRSVDKMYGSQIENLRAAVVAVHRAVSADPDWDGRHRRAALARQSLAAAVSAPPGALYELAEKILADLATAAGGPVAERVDRLREALRAAAPQV